MRVGLKVIVGTLELGTLVGRWESVGILVGILLGREVGSSLGCDEGAALGFSDVGKNVGLCVGR